MTATALRKKNKLRINVSKKNTCYFVIVYIELSSKVVQIILCNSPRNTVVKELLKSVRVWQSYRKIKCHVFHCSRCIFHIVNLGY